jgi:catechol O-methyltransferase
MLGGLGEVRCAGERERSGEEVRFDLLFMDHVEELYLSNLNICKRLGLVRRGSVVVADNVGGERGSVRAREYVKWVEEGDKYETRRVPCVLPNGEEVS